MKMYKTSWCQQRSQWTPKNPVHPMAADIRDIHGQSSHDTQRDQAGIYISCLKQIVCTV